MSNITTICLLTLTVLLSCSEGINNRREVPENISKIIEYFGSSRMKEYDTVTFEKQINWANLVLFFILTSFKYQFFAKHER